MITTQSCRCASESISSPFFLCSVLTASVRVDPNWQLNWQVSFTFFLDRATWRHVKFLHDCLLTGSDAGSKSERIPHWLHKFHVRSDLSEKLSFTMRWTERILYHSLSAAPAFELFMQPSERCRKVWKRGNKKEREMTFSLWNEESHNPQALEED